MRLTKRTVLLLVASGALSACAPGSGGSPSAKALPAGPQAITLAVTYGADFFCFADSDSQGTTPGFRVYCEGASFVASPANLAVIAESPTERLVNLKSFGHTLCLQTESHVILCYGVDTRALGSQDPALLAQAQLGITGQTATAGHPSAASFSGFLASWAIGTTGTASYAGTYDAGTVDSPNAGYAVTYVQAYGLPGVPYEAN